MALADSNPAASGAPRIHSLDIFRGLTVLVMVFVDNLGFVKGLPWWTYHMPREANGMTYVDVVFPAFLFLVGMSIPLTDVDGRPGWLRFIQPLGANPLLAYFLAYVAYFTPRLTFLTADGSFGWQGVLKSLAFTLLVFATTVALARSRVRLQL